MIKELVVTYTQTYHGQPLATVHNLPGGDADLTPAQMRGLAAALLAAADECETRPMGCRSFLRASREYPLSSV